MSPAVFGLRFEPTKQVKIGIKIGIPRWKRESEKTVRKFLKSFPLLFPGLSSRFRTDFVFFLAYPEIVGKVGKRGRSGRELS